MNNLPILIFMEGPPASGKTTLSKTMITQHPEFIRIGADDIRRELYGSEDVYGDGTIIFNEIIRRMRESLLNNQNVIYDAVNLYRQYRLDYLNKLSDINCNRIIICLTVDKEVAKLRHEKRNRSIPWESLEPYFDIHEPPTKDEGWNQILTVSHGFQISEYYPLSNIN